MKYLMALALMCGLSLATTAEAEAAEEANTRFWRMFHVHHLSWSNMFFGGDSTWYRTVGIEDDDWMEMEASLLMEADLADNIAVTGRLFTDRRWGFEWPYEDEFDIFMDWAFITIENVAGRPIDLKIGHQPIIFGDSMQVHYDLDAIKLSILLEPVMLPEPITIDALFARVMDSEVFAHGRLPYIEINDDFIAVHAAYLVPDPNIAINMGYYNLIDRDVRGIVGLESNIGSMAISVNGDILGLLGENAPAIDGVCLLFSGGKILQSGDVVRGIATTTLDANAIYFGAEAIVDVGAMDVGVNFQFVSLSGDVHGTPEYEGFQPLFEYVDFNTVIAYELEFSLGFRSNLNLWGVGLEISPMPRVDVVLNYINLSRDTVALGASDDLGTEINLGIEYALTRNVTACLTMAMFSPGDYFAIGGTEPLGTEDATLMRLGVAVGW